MNIFVLDKDPKKCAEYHNDKHVVKMILESAQMMCTVLNEQGYTTPYRSTHSHHPCTLWLKQSRQNWEWLRDMVTHLNNEYKKRFYHYYDHKSFSVIMSLPTPNLPDVGITKFAQAMPEECKNSNPVKAYRTYYIVHKREISSWKLKKPRWFK